MSSPLLSVILPFFNNAATLKKAADSILRQTLADIELIMIDDGSTDGSFEIALELEDPRIRLERFDTNAGVSTARNRGLDVMRGAYMALMDADDTCPPDRLERTVRHLRANPSLGFCGGWTLWKGWSRFSFVGRQPTGPAAVRAYTLFGMPAQADALTFRADMIRQHDIRFQASLRYSEDFDFLRQCLRVSDGDNIPAVVLHYIRNSGGAMAARTHKDYAYRMAMLEEPLSLLIPAGVDQKQVLFHSQVGNGAGAETPDALQAMKTWLMRLDAANEQHAVFDQEGLRFATALVWFRCCRNSSHLGLAAWRLWQDSIWASYYQPTLQELASAFASWGLALGLPSRRHAQGQLIGFSEETR